MTKNNINSNFNQIATTDANGRVTGITANVANIKIGGGSSGQFLRTDGNGNLSWTTANLNPAGSNTQIQFNANGALGASANLTFDTANSVLSTTNLIANSGVTTANLSATGNVSLGNVANVRINSGTNGQFLQTDGNGNLSWANATTYSTNTIFLYRTTNSTSGYPGDGRFSWNNSTQTSATNLIVSHLTEDALDVELFLSQIVSGQSLLVQDKNNSANYQRWMVSDAPTWTGFGTATAYLSIPVSLNTSGGTGTTGFQPNSEILFALNIGAGGNVTPGDGNGAVQFNNSGSFGGNANLLWDNANNIFTAHGLIDSIYYGADPTRPSFRTWNSRGNITSPQAVQVGDDIVRLQSSVYTGNGTATIDGTLGWSSIEPVISKVTALPTASGSRPASNIVIRSVDGSNNSVDFTIDGATSTVSFPGNITLGNTTQNRLSITPGVNASADVVVAASNLGNISFSVAGSPTLDVGDASILVYSPNGGIGIKPLTTNLYLYNIIDTSGQELRVNNQLYAFGSLTANGTVTPGQTALRIQTGAGFATITPLNGAPTNNPANLNINILNGGNLNLGSGGGNIRIGDTVGNTALLAANAATGTVTLTAGTSGQGLVSSGGGRTPIWGYPGANVTHIYTAATSGNIALAWQLTGTTNGNATIGLNRIGITQSGGTFTIPTGQYILQVSHQIRPVSGSTGNLYAYSAFSTANAAATTASYGNGGAGSITFTTNSYQSGGDWYTATYTGYINATANTNYYWWGFSTANVNTGGGSLITITRI